MICTNYIKIQVGNLHQVLIAFAPVPLIPLGKYGKYSTEFHCTVTVPVGLSWLLFMLGAGISGSFITVIYW